ncbi:MAG: FAD-binding domain-containing protein, partial [Pseudomonadota bacterium]
MPPLPAPESPTKLRFEPTRAAGLARWDHFASRGLRSYAGRRNHDVGPGERTEVSELSPYVRHRLVLEAELVRGALDRHPFQAVEKFVQEVYWRTYWKGWLELRPAVWRDYRQALAARLDEAERVPLATRLQEACAGRTGIDGFDDWVRELLATGYLHNHARMWFASIWTHTLGLPWELGADFCLRHLIDGDPASNTLSWRWVVGLQTPGKVYLARADNVAKYTGGRYAPRGLATDAAVPPAPPPPPASEPSPLATPPAAPAALLLTEEDLHPESLPLDAVEVVGVAAGHAATERSPLGAAPSVLAFTRD